MYFAKTIESPCRSCEKEHLNKEECAEDCDRLQAFQNAILRGVERNIQSFELRYAAVERR